MCKALPPPRPSCPPASAALARSVCAFHGTRAEVAMRHYSRDPPKTVRMRAQRREHTWMRRGLCRKWGVRSGAEGTDWERERERRGRKPWLRRTTAAPPADAAPFRARPFEPSFLPHQPPPALVAYSSAQPPSVLPSIRSNASGVSHVRSCASLRRSGTRWVLTVLLGYSEYSVGTRSTHSGYTAPPRSARQPAPVGTGGRDRLGQPDGVWQSGRLGVAPQCVAERARPRSARNGGEQ